MAPQCRAFSRALEIEKFKAPLFRGPEGAGDTNDWCIIPKKTQCVLIHHGTCLGTEHPFYDMSTEHQHVSLLCLFWTLGEFL